MLEFKTDHSSSKAFALLGAVQIALIGGITLIAVPLPAIQRDFGLTQAELALVSAAYGLPFAGLLLLGGRLADRLGPRRVFLAGVALFGLASVAGGLAPGYGVLLTARFAQGAGAALTAPAAVALVTLLHPDPVARGRAFALWGTLSVTGATTGSLAGGLIASATSTWRWTFAVPVAAALAALLRHRVLPAARERPPAGSLDALGAALATAGLVALSYGLLDGVSPLATGAGVALLAAFLLVEGRIAADPLLPLPFLLNPRRLSALAAIMVTAAASATSAFLLNLWLQQVRGLSPAVTSLILAPTVLIVAMGPVSARLIARYGPRAVTTVGLALGAVSMLLLSRLDDQAAVLCGLALFSFGGGMAFSGATVSALTGAPPGRAGVAGGLANTAMEIGPTAGLAGLVAVAAARTASLGHLGPARATLGGYTLALVVMAAVMILTALLFLITSRESRKDRS